MGKPGFPIPLRKGQGPSPSRGRGCGETRFPHTPAPAAYVHLSRPCGCAAQRRNENKVVPGRAAPSQTLPRVGAWGNPVSPCPCGAGAWGNPVSPPPRREPMFTLAVHAAPPHTNSTKIDCSWEGAALPNPPAGGGMGKPGFPIPCLRARPSRGPGRGEAPVPPCSPKKNGDRYGRHAGSTERRRASAGPRDRRGRGRQGKKWKRGG